MTKPHLNKSPLSFQIVLVVVELVSLVLTETAFERDTTLTYSQKVKLDKFKERVIDELPHDYMKTDLYLVRWLRARDFNINEAEKMLKENIKWRSDNKMDTILEEDWRSYNEKYPYYLDGYARDGKPILTASVGDWDVRAAAIAGNMQQFNRYINKAIEEATTLIRKLQQQGKNISRYDFLINLDHYNVVQHGCLQCMQFYLALVNSYENYYPLYVENLVLFNTPPMFEFMLRGLRPLMSPSTRETLKVLGQDKNSWRKVLLSIANETQLTPEYGGTLDREN